MDLLAPGSVPTYTWCRATGSKMPGGRQGIFKWVPHVNSSEVTLLYRGPSPEAPRGARGCHSERGFSDPEIQATPALHPSLRTRSMYAPPPGRDCPGCLASRTGGLWRGVSRAPSGPEPGPPPDLSGQAFRVTLDVQAGRA